MPMPSFPAARPPIFLKTIVAPVIASIAVGAASAFAAPRPDGAAALPGDPPPMRLKIVDAFKVDQPLTAEKIAAAKQAALAPKESPATGIRPMRAQGPAKVPPAEK